MHVILEVIIYFVLFAIGCRIWDDAWEGAKRQMKDEIEKDILDKLGRRR